jgi:hypothetical protein
MLVAGHTETTTNKFTFHFMFAYNYWSRYGRDERPPYSTNGVYSL